jgi:methylenetetrahydrofolate reductase (NADH)
MMTGGSPWSQNDFSVTVSLDTPKGTDLSALLGWAELFKGRVDAVLVRDCPDAIVKMTPGAACAALLDKGLKPIMGLNARDRNRIAMQGDLLGAWSMGIRDLIIEEGKDPSFGDHPLVKPVRDASDIQCVEMATKLNSGQDVAGGELLGAPDFSVGACVQWLNDDKQIDAEFAKMRRMAEAGVDVFMVSPQFDFERVAALAERAKPLGVPLIVEIMLLKSVGMARYLNDVPGVTHVPDEVIDQMMKAPVKSKAGLQIAVDLIEKLRDVVSGVVLIPLGWEKKIPGVLEAIGR